MMGVCVTVAAGAMRIGVIMGLGVGVDVRFCMLGYGAIVLNRILFFSRFFVLLQEYLTIRHGRIGQRGVVGARIWRPTKDNLISRPM